MKVCEKCSMEIDTKDGDNLCVDCDEREANTARRTRARATRRAREQAMRDCGLVKARGALGGTYWE